MDHLRAGISFSACWPILASAFLIGQWHWNLVKTAPHQFLPKNTTVSIAELICQNSDFLSLDARASADPEPPHFLPFCNTGYLLETAPHHFSSEQGENHCNFLCIEPFVFPYHRARPSTWRGDSRAVSRRKCTHLHVVAKAAYERSKKSQVT